MDYIEHLQRAKVKRERILVELRAGRSQSAIAREFKLTRARVHQIAKDAGISHILKAEL